MHTAQRTAWGVLATLLLASGCTLWPRAEPPAAPDPTAGPVATLLPRGRTDGTTAPALIRGKVTAVDKMLGVIVLDVGQLHAVRPGYGFIVHRGQRFVGRVVIEEVLPDMSSARYGKTMKTHVDVGDDVTTRLLGIE